VIRRVLDGEAGAARDVVLLNAGAALFIAGAVPSVRDGIGRAAAAIDAQDARRTLARLSDLSAAGEQATP
jgi:anthranilate phosphoribosyltransferase